jgi:hypothetical protein
MKLLYPPLGPDTSPDTVLAIQQDSLMPYVSSAEQTRTADPGSLEAQQAVRRLRRILSSVADGQPLEDPSVLVTADSAPELYDRSCRRCGALRRSSALWGASRRGCSNGYRNDCHRGGSLSTGSTTPSPRSAAAPRSGSAEDQARGVGLEPTT